MKKDILILCADGLTGMKEAVEAAYPATEYQRCIVHQVRNTMKYVSDKVRSLWLQISKLFTEHQTNKKRAHLERVTDKWQEKYPNAMKSWHMNWDVISPIFKFSSGVRTVTYTTHAIESLNSTYQKLNH
ncbi:MAG TPA: transposase [Mobilitalea sp.]|nr:transposase [Mobilitalea sp.]